MIEGIFMFLLFACGAFAGFIGGAVIGHRPPRNNPSDTQEHRIASRIWSKEEKQ